MRNNAQKHLHRNKFSGGGGTYSFQHSQMYMDRFYGGATVDANACIGPDGIAEEQDGFDQQQQELGWYSLNHLHLTPARGRTHIYRVDSVTLLLFVRHLLWLFRLWIDYYRYKL